MNLFPRLLLLLAALSLPLPGAEAELGVNETFAGEVATGDFSPLECNSDVEDKDCVSWSDQTYDFINTKVEIPCGTCVTFDEPSGSYIVLEMGISVVGKLVFPPDTNATIETPFIFVEGILEARSNEIVDSTNIDGLHFIMTGGESQPFFPNIQNKPSCAGGYCDVGKKPIVVAGGKLDIQGLDDTCPTWVKLHDVGRDHQVVPDVYPVIPNPTSDCNRAVINENFETGVGHFKSSLGSMDSIVNENSNNFLKVSGRTRSWQGAFINIDSFLRDCMIPDQMYLVKARYRLIHEEDSYSHCHTTGIECLALNMHTMKKNEETTWKTLYETPNIARSTDGTWTDFVAMIKFDDIDLDSTALYQVLYFAGPEYGVRIDIDDVFITLPGEEHFPVPDDQICTNLIVNGDADVDDTFSYPFELMGNLGAYLKVNNEIVNGVNNNYFTVTGRETGLSTIYQTLIQDCVVANTVYTFKMRARVHSPEPTSVLFILKITNNADDANDTTYFYESVGNCPSTSINIGWVFCEHNFGFEEQHQNAAKVELQIMVEHETADVDYDDISITVHSLPINRLILSPDVAQCWGVGAHIVQTSHTISHSDFNELIITAVTIIEGNAVVFIDPPIFKPTTELDDPRFAVEIALLSRNIAFTSKDDDPSHPFHGPHLMILQTPKVAQNIIGVDFRGFGQQGTAGRYPINFHVCGNVAGTIVARNTVRHSHQRCYVVHATDYVKLEYNIAFDTFGHCFMLEDGIEEENSFFHNLGLETKIMPDEGLISIAESDQFAATFWAANPKNYFLGNVAAGSEDNGFWYEFLETVRGASTKLDSAYMKNPSQIPMGYHRKNVMHSNKGEGFKLYPNGYFPEDRALFEDVMSFRNLGDGVLLHNSKNLGIEGGVFADNRRAIEIDKQADDVTVSNAVVIGFSDLYQIDVKAGKRQSHCPAYIPLVGIQLHSFLRYRDSKGFGLTNVTFENFGEDTGCSGSVAIEIDDHTRDGHFDAYSSFHNLTFPAGSPGGEKFNMCLLEKNPMFLHDLVIQDDGSLNPAEDGLSGVIVSNSTAITAFNNNCVDIVGSCALYCEGGCYRGLNIATWNIPGYDALFLEVTDSEGTAFNFQGYFDKKTGNISGDGVPDENENTSYQRRRYYSPILPYGDYTMQFKMAGAPYWPQFVEVDWEDSPDCSPHIDDRNIILTIPTTDCSSLIRNSGGETGGHDHWAHTGGGLRVFDESASSGVNAISSVKRTATWHGIGQFLDTRCLIIGQQYEIIVKIRLQDMYSGYYISCNVNQVQYNATDVCPRVVFRVRKLIGDTIGDVVGGVATKYAYPMASAVGPWSEDKWNMLYGHFNVTDTLAEADSVFFDIERTRPGVNIVIDDVSIIPTLYGCSMPVYNSDFEIGDTRFWRTIGDTEIALYTPGYNSDYALRTTSRSQWWGSMAQDLNKDCLVEGEQFTVRAMILLLDESDNIHDCNDAKEWGVGDNPMDDICPKMSLRIISGTSTDDIDIGSISDPMSQDWSTIFGTFYVSASMAKADLVSIYFRKFNKDINIAVDALSVTMVESNGAQLVNNPDFTDGDTRYYNIYGGGEAVVVEFIEQPGGNANAMAVRKRTSESYGVSQAIDNKFLSAYDAYMVSCDIFLIADDEMKVPFYCDPMVTSGDTRCPTLSLRSQNIGTGFLTRIIASSPTIFRTDAYNNFSGVFQFMEHEIQAESLYLIINNAPKDITMVIDNVRMNKHNLASNVPSLPSNNPTTRSNE